MSSSRPPTAADPHPTALASLAYARAVLGDRNAAAALIAALDGMTPRRYVPPYYLALAHTAMGQLDLAFEALKRGSEERDPAIMNVAVDPRLAALRSDARYGAFLTDLGLRDFHQRVPAAPAV